MTDELNNVHKFKFNYNYQKLFASRSALFQGLLKAKTNNRKEWQHLHSGEKVQLENVNFGEKNQCNVQVTTEPTARQQRKESSNSVLFFIFSLHKQQRMGGQKKTIINNEKKLFRILGKALKVH